LLLDQPTAAGEPARIRGLAGRSKPLKIPADIAAEVAVILTSLERQHDE
jgi:hypothetical protein